MIKIVDGMPCIVLDDAPPIPSDKFYILQFNKEVLNMPELLEELMEYWGSKKSKQL